MQWEHALRDRRDRYGSQPSAPAQAAAEDFDRFGVRDLLELGAGQGRDSCFFAQRGFDVHALDYATSGVAAIRKKAVSAGLTGRLVAAVADIRERLPFPDSSFDACFSHMLFCMALREAELLRLTAEVHRVLRPGGLHVYTARTTSDPDCGKGVHVGERLYLLNGFAVHFFDEGTVRRLADGFEVLSTVPFEEGALPRRLVRVTLRAARPGVTAPRA